MAKLTYADKVNLSEKTSIPAINKITDDDMNEIKSVVNANDVVGIIQIWSTATAPTGFLLCDGTAVSRTTYADLFAVIGTTYGVGDNSTTFNVPNLKGKVVVGVSGTETEFDTLAETGGTKTSLLTRANLPYSVTDEFFNTSGSATTGAVIGSIGNGSYGISSSAYSGLPANQPHNNLQPYIALNYIIKT